MSAAFEKAWDLVFEPLKAEKIISHLKMIIIKKLILTVQQQYICKLIIISKVKTEKSKQSLYQYNINKRNHEKIFKKSYGALLIFWKRLSAKLLTCTNKKLPDNSHIIKDGFDAKWIDEQLVNSSFAPSFITEIMDIICLCKRRSEASRQHCCTH